MKIIKSNQISIFTRHIKIEKKDFLVVSGMVCFDLDSPEFLIDEQTMWKKISKKLNGKLFDEGLPKVQGEFLACATAYGNDTTGVEVEIKIGEKSKKLAVFGDREWIAGIPSKPKKFTSMDIIYRNLETPPNVEYLDNLTTSKNDLKEAGFMPLDITHPLRYPKLGTYDENYKQTNWPHFPDDIDYSVFNQAPLDQQFDTFLSNEKIKLKNLNSEKPIINSYIPKTSLRCFIQKEEFLELELRKDTLWLFPDLMIGVVIFRGMIETKNDVFEDINYIYLQHEIEKKTINEYYRLFKKQIDFGEDLENNDALFDKMEEEIKKAQESIFHIPKEIDDELKKMTKEAPAIKHSPTEVIHNLKEKIPFTDKSLFNNFMDSLTKVEENLSQLEVNKKELETFSKKIISDNHLDEIPQTEEIMKDTSLIKVDKYFDFVNHCAKRFLKTYQPPFNERIINRTLVGKNENTKLIDDIEFPAGLVFPRFEKDKLKSIRILHNYRMECFYGDKNFPTLFCENEKYALFITNNDLEGIIVNDEVYDFCNVLVCNDLDKLENKDILETASIIFYHSFEEVKNLDKAIKLDLKEYKDILHTYKHKQLRDIFFEHLPDGKGFKKEKKISADEVFDKNKKAFEIMKLKLHKGVDEKIAKMKDKVSKLVEGLEEKLEPQMNYGDYGKQQVPKSEFDENYISALFDTNIFFLSNNKYKNNPKVIEKVEELKKQKIIALDSFKKLKSLEEKGLKEIEKAEEKISQLDSKELPDWAKELEDKIPKFEYSEAEFLAQDNYESIVFNKIDISNIEVNNITFKQVVFKNDTLKNITFKNCYFEMVYFDITLENVKFIDCEIKMSLFKEKKADISFENSNIEMLLFSDMEINLNIYNSKIDNLVFSNTTLKGEFNSSFENTHFIKSKLKLDFKGKYKTCLFNESEIENSDFDINSNLMIFVKTNIKNSNFKNSILEKARFMKETIIENCDFSLTNLNKSSFYQMKIISTKFIKAQLEKSFLNFTNIKKSDFRKVNFKFGRFEYCNSQKTLFGGCNFMRNSFKGSKFSDCSFIYSNLYEVNFMDTKLINNLFDGANMEKTFIKRECFED